MEDNEKTFPDDTLVTMFRGGDNHAFEVLLARYTGDIKKVDQKEHDEQLRYCRRSVSGNSRSSL